MTHVSAGVELVFLSWYFFSFSEPPHSYTYTLSLHDALPILNSVGTLICFIRTLSIYSSDGICSFSPLISTIETVYLARSEEHTSELQSHVNLVCRLLLEKKKNSCLSREYTDLSSTIAVLLPV